MKVYRHILSASVEGKQADGGFWFSGIAIIARNKEEVFQAFRNPDVPQIADAIIPVFGEHFKQVGVDVQTRMYIGMSEDSLTVSEIMAEMEEEDFPYMVTVFTRIV